jgi:hypothetical protein
MQNLTHPHCIMIVSLICHAEGGRRTVSNGGFLVLLQEVCIIIIRLARSVSGVTLLTFQRSGIRVSTALTPLPRKGHVRNSAGRKRPTGIPCSGNRKSSLKRMDGKSYPEIRAQKRPFAQNSSPSRESARKGNSYMQAVFFCLKAAAVWGGW